MQFLRRNNYILLCRKCVKIIRYTDHCVKGKRKKKGKVFRSRFRLITGGNVLIRWPRSSFPSGVAATVRRFRSN